MTEDVPRLDVTNIEDGETVHQRCIIITGTCTESENDNGSISIVPLNTNNEDLFPAQKWPTGGDNFKALTMLSPGINKLSLNLIDGEDIITTTTITVDYVPLLNNPPLHLVIMLAKDSTMSSKEIEEVIAKFRMTAYMWQAMTAEDMWDKSFGRRTFRLDEEVGVDSTSRAFAGRSDVENAMHRRAKVHVTRSVKTVQDIREADEWLPDDEDWYPGSPLLDAFCETLDKAEGIVGKARRPVVAGLIFDSKYDIGQDIRFNKVILARPGKDGTTVGVTGGRLVHTWPRCMEDIVSCLTDATLIETESGNESKKQKDAQGADLSDDQDDDDEEEEDNEDEEHNEDRIRPIGNMWEACAASQGALLQQIAWALGSTITRDGMMRHGYAYDWPKNFLSRTADGSGDDCEGDIVQDGEHHLARWHELHKVNFRAHALFKMPDDPDLSMSPGDGKPRFCTVCVKKEDGTFDIGIRITALHGISAVFFNNMQEGDPFRANTNEPIDTFEYAQSELRQRFGWSETLTLKVFSYDGQNLYIYNIWKLLPAPTSIAIPGSSVVLTKRGYRSHDHVELEKRVVWNQLLVRKHDNGSVHRAVEIKIRMADDCWSGGSLMHADGHMSYFGPMMINDAYKPEICETQEAESLSESEITRVEMNYQTAMRLDGLHIHLSDGTTHGQLNAKPDTNDIINLMPLPDEVIVGFYGQLAKEYDNGVLEFGIITVPKVVGFEGLPHAIFGMDELRNTGLDD